MGTGNTIDEVIMYQLESQGFNDTELEQTQEVFDMIIDGDLNGYDTVYLLGVPAKAIFWKQWIDAENNINRLSHISQLNNILTINSDTDWNVPPFAYEPLHEIIDKVSSNPHCNLHSSVNVFPNMIHTMEYYYDYNAGIFNVSNDIINLIGNWALGVIHMDAVPISDACLMSIMVTDKPTQTPIMKSTSTPVIEPTFSPTFSPTIMTKVKVIPSNKSGVMDIVVGVFIGLGVGIICLIFMLCIMGKVCGYSLRKNEADDEASYSLIQMEK
eukprot:187439_1